MNTTDFKKTQAYNQAKSLYDEGKKHEAVAILMQYDVLKHSSKGKRRAIYIDRGKVDQKGYDRLQGIAIGRDLQENTANAKSMIKQFRLNVAGSIKAQFNSSDAEFNQQASFYFNSIYSKNCSFIDQTHLVKLAQNLVACLIREGDCLVIFDDFIEDTGKLKFFESDQLVSVDKSDWESKRPSWCNDSVPMSKQSWTGRKRYEDKAYEQSAGIITDKWGRVQGYVVSSKRGLTVAKIEDCMIIPADSATLFKSTERMNQYRGISELLTTAPLFADIYEMRAKELASAKLSASWGGVIKSVGNEKALDDLLNDSKSLDELIAGEINEPAKRNYGTLDALAGGNITYLDSDDEFKPLDLDRPNLNTETFYATVNASAGSSLGLAGAYSNLTATNSYTAFRGDMILSWVTFEDLQKQLERDFLDWLVNKACKWAIDKGLLQEPTDALWNYKVCWKLPKMKQIDPVKTATANKINLKCGLTDYSELLGADWREKLDSLGEQIEYAKERGIPLDLLETISGAIIPETKDDE